MLVWKIYGIVSCKHNYVVEWILTIGEKYYCTDGWFPVQLDWIWQNKKICCYLFRNYFIQTSQTETRRDTCPYGECYLLSSCLSISRLNPTLIQMCPFKLSPTVYAVSTFQIIRLSFFQVWHKLRWQSDDRKCSGETIILFANNCFTCFSTDPVP